jgi:uncharacterized protein
LNDKEMPNSPTYITPELQRAVAGGYLLEPSGIHGYAHWARVCEFGRHLAITLDVDPRLTDLFALVHDCRRLDDGHDEEHGPRAAAELRNWQGELFELPTSELDRLLFACEYHTAGQVSDDPLVGICWDADRLDLRRLHYEVDVRLLSTSVAKAPELLNWSGEMSEGLVTPSLLQREWALLGG